LEKSTSYEGKRKYIIAKTKDVETGCNVAEAPMEGCG
jgi:hypothetical protein